MCVFVSCWFVQYFFFFILFALSDDDNDNDTAPSVYDFTIAAWLALHCNGRKQEKKKTEAHTVIIKNHFNLIFVVLFIIFQPLQCTIYIISSMVWLFLHFEIDVVAGYFANWLHLTPCTRTHTHIVILYCNISVYWWTWWLHTPPYNNFHKYMFSEEEKMRTA